MNYSLLVMAVVAISAIVALVSTVGPTGAATTSYIILNSGMDSSWLSDNTLLLLEEKGVYTRGRYLIIPDDMMVLKTDELDQKTVIELARMQSKYHEQMIIAGDAVAPFSTIKSYFN